MDRVITEHPRASTQWKAREKRRMQEGQRKTGENAGNRRENQEENIYWGHYLEAYMIYQVIKVLTTDNHHL